MIIRDYKMAFDYIVQSYGITATETAIINEGKKITVREVMANDVGASNPDWAKDSLTANAWNDLFTVNSVTEGTAYFIYGVWTTDSTPGATAVKLTVNNAPVRIWDTQSLYVGGNVPKEKYFDKIEDGVGFKERSSVTISAYTKSTSTTTGLYGWIGEPLGRTVHKEYKYKASQRL